MADLVVQRLEVSNPEAGYTMNCYIVSDPRTGATAIVDPGGEPERIVDAAGNRIDAIWITHAHPDHVASLQPLRDATGARVLAHPLEVESIPGGADVLVRDGDAFSLGDQPVRVLHIPGHTAGHVAFVLPGHILAGDLLFPGGPGHTYSRQEFRTLISGLAGKLLPLDGALVVHPGHGEPTTIGAARREYEAFLLRPDREGLFGDVTWAASE